MRWCTTAPKPRHATCWRRSRKGVHGHLEQLLNMPRPGRTPGLRPPVHSTDPAVPNPVCYLTATRSTGRMLGSLASSSADTLANAAGISPLMCATRASSVAKVSKMP